MKAYPVKAVLVFALGAALAGCSGEGPDEAADATGAAADAGEAADDAGPSMAEVRAGNFKDGYHFVQISTHGAPRWSAWVDERDDRDGHLINTHSVGTRSGGKANFWYWGYPGTHYLIHIWSAQGNGGHVVEETITPTTIDLCYQVNALGVARRTGDSTNGCNIH
jgi:hypothetical protein